MFLEQRRLRCSSRARRIIIIVVTRGPAIMPAAKRTSLRVRQALVKMKGTNGMSSEWVEKQEGFNRVLEERGGLRRRLVYEGIKEVRLWELNHSLVVAADDGITQQRLVLVNSEDSLDLWVIESGDSLKELETYYKVHQSEGGMKRLLL